MQEEDRLKKIQSPEHNNNNTNTDWFAAVVVMLLLVAIVAKSSQSNQQLTIPDTIPAKTDKVVATPDSMHVEQGTFAFDSIPLIKLIKQK